MQYFQCIITILFVGLNAAGKNIRTDEHITRLNLADNNLLIINRETFNKYRKLEVLNLINSQVSSIEDGAFYDLPNLSQLNISKNFITSLSSRIFRPDNKMWKLVVSHNTISDFDAFDISYFPALALLDISNNRIRSLPLNFVDKLNENGNFTLITSDNPWDCENGNWSLSLSKNLREKFCKKDFEHIPKPMASQSVPQQASFVSCIFWSSGAFWIGIIVGNVCLIRRIVFPKKGITKKDQSTQYDILMQIDNVLRTECRIADLSKQRSVQRNNQYYIS